MKNILILYFSGNGATKFIAQNIKNILSDKKFSTLCNVELYSIENINTANLNQYDAFIIGTPVYHAAPCKLIINFFETADKLDKICPTFLFNSRGLYSCNTNRILAKKILNKNFAVIKDKDYQSPASDGALIFPFINRFFKFDKNLKTKLYEHCCDFVTQVHNNSCNSYIPRFRIISIFNAPNKLLGQHSTFPIYLHEKSCIQCNKCINNCPHNSIETDLNGFPKVNSKSCENCYRCIHNCPKMALSLNKHKPPRKLIVYSDF